MDNIISSNILIMVRNIYYLSQKDIITQRHYRQNGIDGDKEKL